MTTTARVLHGKSTLLVLLCTCILWSMIITHSTDAACLDDGGAADCTAWEAVAECEHNPSYMYSHCANACRSTCLCPEYAQSGILADTNCFCAYWASIGLCQSSPNFMNASCQSSCYLVKTVDCGPAPDVINTTKTTSYTTWGGNTTYQCSSGYEQTGGARGLRYCKRNATWVQLWYGDGLDPICKAWVCPAPVVVAGATLVISNPALTYNTTVTYTCNQGLQMAAGNQVIVCGNKTWLGTPPTCSVTWCGAPLTVDGATYVNNGTGVGDTTVYTCSGVGAQLTGEATLTCGRDRSWGIPPSCSGGSAAGVVTSPLVVYITVPLLVLLAAGIVPLCYYLYVFYTSRRTPPNKVADSHGSQLSLIQIPNI